MAHKRLLKGELDDILIKKNVFTKLVKKIIKKTSGVIFLDNNLILL